MKKLHIFVFFVFKAGLEVFHVELILGRLKVDLVQVSHYEVLIVGGSWVVVTLEDEIGDGPLTFILILKSCGLVDSWDIVKKKPLAKNLIKN